MEKPTEPGFRAAPGALLSRTLHPHVSGSSMPLPVAFWVEAGT